MGSVATKQAGIASGVNNAVSRTAGLLGIAILGIVILHAYNFELNRKLAGLLINSAIRHQIDDQRVRLAATELPESLDEGTRNGLKATIDESFVFGFRMVMFCAIGLALASALAAFMMIQGNASSSGAEMKERPQ
jgi:predicted MFS family arabinose efflux permease